MTKSPGNHWKATALCAAALLASLPSSGQAQHQTFSYYWKPGTQTAYSAYVMGEVLEGRTASSIKLRFQDVWEVVGEDKVKGLFRVTETCREFTGTELDLRSFGLPRNGERIDRMVDHFGRVSLVSGYQEPDRFYFLPLVFPQVPIRTGGRWKHERKLKLPLFNQQVEADLTVIYTFKQIVKNYKGRGRDCAHITLEAAYSYQSPDRSRTLSGAIKGRIFFDLVEKRIVDYELKETREEKIAPARKKRTSLQITLIQNR